MTTPDLCPTQSDPIADLVAELPADWLLVIARNVLGIVRDRRGDPAYATENLNCLLAAQHCIARLLAHSVN